MEYNQYNNSVHNNQYDNMNNVYIGMGNGNNISMSNMPDMSNIPKNKKHKKKKRGGCLLGIIKFFLFIALILLVIFGYRVYKKNKEWNYRVTNKLHLYSAGGAFQNTLGTLFQCTSIDFFDENGELINKSRDK